MRRFAPPSLPPQTQTPPAAIYRLDAAQRLEFWASLALRHTPDLQARNR